MVESGLLLFVIRVLKLQTTMFHSIPQITKHKERKGSHPPLLVGGECVIERLPCIRYLLEIGASLSQGIGAPVQEGDWIPVAHDFDNTPVTKFIL